MKNNKHISKEQWIRFCEHDMNQIEMMDFFTHISHCEFCAGKMEREIPNEKVRKAPHDLEDEVLRKTKSFSKKQVTKKNNQVLFFYSLRVGLASCLAIILLFTWSPEQIGTIDRLSKNPYNQSKMGADTLAQEMDSFSNRISNRLHSFVNINNSKNMEVKGND